MGVGAGLSSGLPPTRRASGRVQGGGGCCCAGGGQAAAAAEAAAPSCSRSAPLLSTPRGRMRARALPLSTAHEQAMQGVASWRELPDAAAAAAPPPLGALSGAVLAQGSILRKKVMLVGRPFTVSLILSPMTHARRSPSRACSGCPTTCCASAQANRLSALRTISAAAAPAAAAAAPSSTPSTPSTPPVLATAALGMRTRTLKPLCGAASSLRGAGACRLPSPATWKLTLRRFKVAAAAAAASGSGAGEAAAAAAAAAAVAASTSLAPQALMQRSLSSAQIMAVSRFRVYCAWLMTQASLRAVGWGKLSVCPRPSWYATQSLPRTLGAAQASTVTTPTPQEMGPRVLSC